MVTASLTASLPADRSVTSVIVQAKSHQKSLRVHSVVMPASEKQQASLIRVFLREEKQHSVGHLRHITNSSTDRQEHPTDICMDNLDGLRCLSTEGLEDIIRFPDMNQPRGIRSLNMEDLRRIIKLSMKGFK